MDPRRRADLSVGWADLPPELLEGIMKLMSPLERVTVRLVCSSWRTCARASFPSDLAFEAPRLLLRRPGPPRGPLAFFSLRRAEILPFALPARLSAARCCGHMGGWLAMALDDDREIALCSVTSGESVGIPRPPVFPVAKVVLSAPPTTRGWVVAVLGRSGTIALLQPDAEGEGGRWMAMEDGAKHGGFEDMAIWRGRLCALGGDGAEHGEGEPTPSSNGYFNGHLLGCSRTSTNCFRFYIHLYTRVRGRVCMYLVVDMSGSLVVVQREYSVRRDAVEVEVEVSRFAAEERKWEAVEELAAGEALFVGSVVSVAARATEGSGIRGNCVYMARREVELIAPHAIGVYSLADGEADGLAISGGHSLAAEPVWIAPSLA
uniref:F-box domain-containing protein n=1 Tax=Oryza barthii TaxID=65489 RepID=A0A0D3FRJ4_9ORYZ